MTDEPICASVDCKAVTWAEDGLCDQCRGGPPKRSYYVGDYKQGRDWRIQGNSMVPSGAHRNREPNVNIIRRSTRLDREEVDDE